MPKRKASRALLPTMTTPDPLHSWRLSESQSPDRQPSNGSTLGALTLTGSRGRKHYTSQSTFAASTLVSIAICRACKVEPLNPGAAAMKNCQCGRDRHSQYAARRATTGAKRLSSRLRGRPKRYPLPNMTAQAKTNRRRLYQLSIECFQVLPRTCEIMKIRLVATEA